MSYCDNAIYYYTVNDNQSTSTKNISVEKIDKNIKDIKRVFEFVRNFLKENKVYEKYQKEFELWENFYVSMHVNK